MSAKRESNYIANGLNAGRKSSNLFKMGTPMVVFKIISSVADQVRRKYPPKPGYRELYHGEIPDRIFDRESGKEVSFIGWHGEQAHIADGDLEFFTPPYWYLTIDWSKNVEYY